MITDDFLHYPLPDGSLAPVFNDVAVFQDDHDPGETYAQGSYIDWLEYRNARPAPGAVVLRQGFGMRTDAEFAYNEKETRRLAIPRISYDWNLGDLIKHDVNGTPYNQGKRAGVLALGLHRTVLDLESTTWYSLPTVSQIQEWEEGFRSVNEKTLLDVLYGRKEELDRLQGNPSTHLRDHWLWIAAYGRNDGVIHKYMLDNVPVWSSPDRVVALQFWEGPPIPGVSNKIDMNVWLRGDYWDMLEFWGENVLRRKFWYRWEKIMKRLKGIE